MRRFCSFCLVCLAQATVFGQQILPTMPGYERYVSQPRQLARAAKIARVSPIWNADGASMFYTKDGKTFKVDLKTGKGVETTEKPDPQVFDRGTNVLRGFSRGQQPTEMSSPDGEWQILYRARNVYLKPKDGPEVALTTDATDANRWKYGQVTWAYNEELNQHLPFWWSPNSAKVAYYRFDESKIPDYILTRNATGTQNSALIEAYPKAGAENAVTDVFIYDLKSKQTTQIDVRDGKPFSNDCQGHYVYDVSWSPDGEELRFLRANRRQNGVQWCGADPKTGKVRIIARETNPDGWCATNPHPTFLKDGKRFIWASERNKFRNLYLMDVTGKLLTTLTNHNFDVETIVRVDEASGTLYYTARTGANPHFVQLFRVGLNGKGALQLTDGKLSHTTQLSPNGQRLVDTAFSTVDPPEVRLVDANGKVMSVLATSDLTEFEKLGGRKPERVVYKSADGKYDLFGKLHLPSNFDATKKYPVLVTVYNGPESANYDEFFSLPNELTELGFLVFEPESRGGDHRGRAFLDAMYQHMGIVEIDDIAAGVKALGQRSYVDAKRVGIFGTSYGGYASAMAILRYPDVFAAASASSPVTDWRHYDSIYTERYMWIPQENAAGYDAGSAMTYAKDLKGALLLYFGTLDDNVHPANTMALIRALERNQKSFDVQLTPDAGHSGVNFQRMLEFFIQNLKLKP